MPVEHEGVCISVGGGTKKFHRNSEKGTDIGMHFVIFACLTSKSNGLTRSRGRPSGSGKGKGRWVGPRWDSVQVEFRTPLRNQQSLVTSHRTGCWLPFEFDPWA